MKLSYVIKAGFGGSSFSGFGSSGDYLAISQSNKPLINIYEWGKSQVKTQCHTQEIMTSVCCDTTGTYLFAGSRKGWLSAWDLSTGNLLNTWQAHVKSITRLAISQDGNFCISAAQDGLCRAWEISSILDQSKSTKVVGKVRIDPYR